MLPLIFTSLKTNQYLDFLYGILHCSRHTTLPTVAAAGIAFVQPDLLAEMTACLQS